MSLYIATKSAERCVLEDIKLSEAIFTGTNIKLVRNLIGYGGNFSVSSGVHFCNSGFI